MARKIFRSIFITAILVLCAVLIVATGFLYEYFGNMQINQLKDELSLISVATEKLGEEYLADLEPDSYRVTWIAADGKVLYDTETAAANMENHGDREEVIEALKDGTGSSSRYSSTLAEKTFYEAVKLSDGTVLRVSVNSASAGVLVMGMISPVVAIIFVALIVSMIFANKIATRITEPLNKLDLDHPLDNDTYEELSPLLNRIYHQHRQLSSQMSALNQQKKEFEKVTDNMKEALVLINESRRIISINPAAISLFNTDVNVSGQDFLTIDRKPDMSLAIDKALETGHSEVRTERNGREYQFDISRIEAEGRTAGAAILAFDITEQADAERLRREFSANVSHELKTPLQSIIGSAELIENGMVKEEDKGRFVKCIREEAARLVTLVDDTIRLSQLDEKSELTKERVSLYTLAEETVASLKPAAMVKNISVSVHGDNGNTIGVEKLLYEVIYNLCDNAIKYNVEGGTVDVSVTETDNDVICCVKDTGIGIPKEHQSRVFERFYRVDKSHSKKSGGTGLGLSIVKHAVAYHNGRIELESDVGKGTTITVILPKQI